MGPTPDATMRRSTCSQSCSDSSSTSSQVGDNSAVIPYYTRNIKAACQAANTPRPQDLSTEEEVQLAKRRKSNRLSARRWRNRKKRNFSELRQQIVELAKVQSELLLEKAKLEVELKAEIQLAMNTSPGRFPSLPFSGGHGYPPQLSVPTMAGYNNLLHALLANQSQGRSLSTEALLYSQSFGTGPIIMHPLSASHHVSVPFPMTTPTGHPLQASQPLSLREANAVSALLRGFLSEAEEALKRL